MGCSRRLIRRSSPQDAVLLQMCRALFRISEVFGAHRSCDGYSLLRENDEEEEKEESELQMRKKMKRSRRSNNNKEKRNGGGGAPVDVPKGHCAVYVGNEDERVRFVIPTKLLHQHVLKSLLAKAAEEYGFHHSLGLIIPCDHLSFLHYLASSSSSTSTSLASS